MELALGGRSWLVQEPVFKTLRQVIALYQQLGDATQSDTLKLVAITQMMRLLIPDPLLFPPFWYRLRHFRTIKPLTAAEIADFLKAIPIICKLDVVKPPKLKNKTPGVKSTPFLPVAMAIPGMK